MALGEVTKIDDKTSYYAINYAAFVSPFLAYSKDDVSSIEINGHSIPCHSGIVRLPLSVDYAELLSVYAEPCANLTFTHAGKSYAVKAYLGSQKYTPPAAWQWSFDGRRWACSRFRRRYTPPKCRRWRVFRFRVLPNDR